MNIYVVICNGDIDSAFCVENEALARKAEIGTDVTVRVIVTQLYGLDLLDRADTRYMDSGMRSGRFGSY